MRSPYVMMNLLAGLYWFDEALQNTFEEQGFVPAPRSQSMVLVNLAMGENRPSRLARNLGVTRQAMSQLLAQMEERGLIEILPHPTDRRARVVTYSPASKAIRDSALVSLAALEEELGRRIGRGRLTALREALAMDWGPPPERRPETPPAKPRRTAS